MTPNVENRINQIVLNLPKSKFIVSFSGAKYSGDITREEFKRLDAYIRKESKTKPLLESMTDLLNIDLLNTLIPGWDIFQIGDTVEFVDDATFSDKYPGIFEIKEIRGNYIFIDLPNKAGELREYGFSGREFRKVRE